MSGFESNRTLKGSQFSAVLLRVIVVDTALFVLCELIHSRSNRKWVKNIKHSVPSLQIKKNNNKKGDWV